MTRSGWLLRVLLPVILVLLGLALIGLILLAQVSVP
jgi:uncharacterized membrane protein (Fun14 family)